MIAVSSNFKAAMKKPVKELDAYIRIDANNSITSADDLISIKISCDSGMCKAAMRKLEAKYLGEHNLLGQWVHVGFGVRLPNSTFEYLDYGSFLITEITSSKDTGITQIVAYDKMINSMTQYSTLEALYPIGLYDYTEMLCQACGLTLGNASFTTHNNWQVTEELWENINGITYRDILQQIAQVTGTTCIISNDDKVYFKTINRTNETITYDNLFKLKLEPIYGEINSVVLSREPITGEDVFMKDDESIEEYGLTEFKIDSNQLVDKRREEAITPIYDALHGISFYPFEAHTEGLGWYEIGDNFDIINDTEDTFNTTLFNYSIVVDGGITETLKTKAETKTQTQYQYASKTSKRIANAEIIVDKQQNEIREIVSTIEAVEREQSNNYQELLTKFQPIEETLTDIESIERDVLQLQTDTYTKTEIQQIANGTGVNGVKVSAVISTSGTFDENGMTYEKTNAPTKTTINEVGVNVKDTNDNSLLFAGYVNSNNADYQAYRNQTIVGTDNIVVKNYLNIGSHSRIQDYGNGTGVFWR